MGQVGLACSTGGVCTDQNDGHFICGPQGLMCQHDTSFKCDAVLIREFRILPNEVKKGGMCTLYWDTVNATKCNIVDDQGHKLLSNTVLPDGDTKTNPIDKTTKYTLHCENDDGIAVDSQPVTCRLQATVIEN